MPETPSLFLHVNQLPTINGGWSKLCYIERWQSHMQSSSWSGFSPNGQKQHSTRPIWICVSEVLDPDDSQRFTLMFSPFMRVAEQTNRWLLWISTQWSRTLKCDPEIEFLDTYETRRMVTDESRSWAERINKRKCRCFRTAQEGFPAPSSKTPNERIIFWINGSYVHVFGC